MATCSLGTQTARSNGAPAAVRHGVSPSIMTQVQYNQFAFWMPLAKFHRPFTRYPPATSQARPPGRAEPAPR